MSGTIFISYRRGEDAGAAGRLYDRLEHTFGPQRLFMDVDNIPPGQDFVAVLDAQVAACDVFLALIGRGWLTATNKNGNWRLDNPDDFVRFEIGRALAQRKCVIPVLVDDATMPRADVLPNELKDLPRRQAIRMAHDRFREDAERLVRVLERVLAEVEDQREAKRRRAEEKARRQGEEAKRRQAEEEARRQGEEAKRRQAEEEARRQGEEAKRRQAEEEARRQGEEAKHPASGRTSVLVIAGAITLFVLGSGYLAWDILSSDKQPAVGSTPPTASGPSLQPEGPPGSAEAPPPPPAVSTTNMTPQKPQTAIEPAPVMEPPSQMTTKSGAFQDCPLCPPMIEVPTGTFQMGRGAGDTTEQPAHEVALKYRFAIGVREVTYGEWLACVKDQGCKYAPELVPGTDQTPMRNVSWEDAVQYTEWLKTKTQQPYRLPTEAEWEYAARANTTTGYWWGNEPGVDRANCNGCGGKWDREHPAEAGSYPPNPFGIYDMNGSVWEWVADCWHPSYKGAPNDGQSWETSRCKQRVLRGGSWRDDPGIVSSFSRFYYDSDVRYIGNGFRVARTLD